MSKAKADFQNHKIEAIGCFGLFAIFTCTSYFSGWTLLEISTYLFPMIVKNLFPTNLILYSILSAVAFLFSILSTIYYANLTLNEVKNFFTKSLGTVLTHSTGPVEDFEFELAHRKLLMGDHVGRVFSMLIVALAMVCVVVFMFVMASGLWPFFIHRYIF